LRDERGFVLTGQALLCDEYLALGPSRPPMPLETSVHGVIPVRDARHGSVKRVASAAGEGSVSIPLIHEYLNDR
jgi:thioredoxin reductase (NADPH)